MAVINNKDFVKANMNTTNSTPSATAAQTNSSSIINRLLPDCYLYISHLDEGYKYWALPGYPNSVTDSMTTRFGETTALGRSAPVYTFSNSGPRTITIDLEFHRDMFEEMPSNVVPNEGEDKAESFIQVDFDSMRLPYSSMSKVKNVKEYDDVVHGDTYLGFIENLFISDEMIYFNCKNSGLNKEV